MSFHLISQAYAAPVIGTRWASLDCASDGVATIKGIECLVQNILSPIPGLIALAAVFMIIISGFRIVTAGSDQKALASAWASFTYSVIGLVLLSAIWLVIVLIEKFTGVPVTQFSVGI